MLIQTVCKYKNISNKNAMIFFEIQSSQVIYFNILYLAGVPNKMGAKRGPNHGFTNCAKKRAQVKGQKIAEHPSVNENLFVEIAWRYC